MDDRTKILRCSLGDRIKAVAHALDAAAKLTDTTGDGDVEIAAQEASAAVTRACVEALGEIENELHDLNGCSHGVVRRRITARV